MPDPETFHVVSDSEIYFVGDKDCRKHPTAAKNICLVQTEIKIMLKVNKCKQGEIKL